MELKEIFPYISTIVAAIISGVISFVLAVKKSSGEITQLRTQNEHEISKLMNQHKLDLESLERKHTLDLETREKEHKYQLEIMEKENQNAITARTTKWYAKFSIPRIGRWIWEYAFWCFG